jgi:hypothetical protein
MSKRERPSPAEIAQVKAEGLDPKRAGWLRSRYMGMQWPRPNVCACGRTKCDVCNPKSAERSALLPTAQARRKSTDHDRKRGHK